MTTWKSKKGFTLVEMIVGFAMAFVAMAALGSLMIQMRSQLKSAERKYESLTYRTLFANTLADLTNCTCQLSANTAPIDVDNLPGAEFNIAKIESKCGAGASVVAQANVAIPGTQTGLTIDAVKLYEVVAHTAPNEYRGKLKLSFRPENGTVSLKHFDVDARFILDPAAPNNAKTIQSCTFVSSASGGASGTYLAGLTCPTGQVLVGFNADGSLSCVAGGGGGGGGPYSITSPGTGCTGDYCSTADFGPCNGDYCRTNGNRCDGDFCSARGPTATCSGFSCCSGPSCP